MRRIPPALLRDMANDLSAEDRDEMAVPSYLHRNPAMRFMAWRRVEAIAARLEASCDASQPLLERTILDFGCGTGVLLGEAHARAGRVVGVDLVLEPARRLVREWSLDRTTLLTPDQALRQIEPASVDTIIAAEVLEHIEPLTPTLAFFRTALKRGGRLLVSLPTENAVYRLGRKLAGFGGHYHHSNARSVDHAIAGAGFRRTRRERIPLPAPFDIYWVLDYVGATE